MWADIEGYKFPYRISEGGEVQSFGHGAWTTIKYIYRNRCVFVYLKRKNNTYATLPVTRLMADAFLGGKKPGTCVLHRNNLWSDNRLENLEVAPMKKLWAKLGGSGRRGVAKIDRTGEVVEFFPSISDAARAELTSFNAIKRRCLRLSVRDEFLLTGYSYRWADSLEG